ncbi:MAG TPA: glycoside hydrolase family 2 protein [Verrucomicrobiae bacterium]|nr:glycoside hydrolase family 2 protein [Verrucomicrobiae bacterium]
MRNSSVRQFEIIDNWMFCDGEAGVLQPATVPGCVHTDLMRLGRIPDPFYGSNEKELQWIGEKEWIYQTTFDLPAALLAQEHVELVFRGLDTYATVTLNGSPILAADNMFREYRISCKSLLREKSNVLVIRFASVFDVNLPKYDTAPYRLEAFPTNDQADEKIAMYSRKAQFHYGWDWGPRLITCGVWRPVVVEAWSDARLRSVFVRQENVSPTGADILSKVEVLSDNAQDVRLSVFMDSVCLAAENHSLAKGLNRITIKGHLADPKLWWTNGLGDQHLYQYRTTLESSGNLLDEYTASIGVRSLDIVRVKDASGTSLYVRLNGVPVFMKGANYIPQDNFQNRVTPDRYEHIVGSAAKANMNMLRLWGGGIYEQDVFYETCDRHGILIWHDFQFACAMYPADDAFLETVRQEIIDNVTRIRNHASIALYCGNNENAYCWHQVWKPKCPPDIQRLQEADMRKLYCGTIPKALKEADPTRYYHLSSPDAGFDGIGYGDGDIHYWGVWHGKEPFENYLKNIARFVSEYGFQSYPELSTVRKFAAPNDRSLHSEVMLAHQRCTSDERKDTEYGNRLIQQNMDAWYKTPRDFESYLYVSQIMQADGVRVGMEAHRRAMPFCMGSLFWQIDDCWPAASWSSIDYFGRWKALHYAARRSFAACIVSPVLKPNEVEFWIVSDALAPIAGRLDIAVLDYSGNEVSRRSKELTIAPNSSQLRLTVSRHELSQRRDEAELVLVSRFKNGDEIIAENLSCFCLPKELKLSPPEISSQIRKSSIGYVIELTCRSFAKSVMLSCVDDPGFFTDNYFDLLPNETRTIEYQTNLDESRMLQQLKVTSLVESYTG